MTDTDKKKEYFKIYYQKKKEQRIKDNNQTVECKLCNRTVTTENYLTYSKSKICKKYYNRKLNLMKKLKELKENEI